MSLTIHQKELVHGLKYMGMEQEDMLAIMLLMETDEMADQMIDWIVSMKDEVLTYGQIQRKALALNKQLSRTIR